MKPLTRKLQRDLWQMRGQVLAICVVIAGGMATLIMALSSLDSLYRTRESFYRDYRFAQLFASLTRAPESVREIIAALPGVQQVETRIVAAANLDLPGFPEPATGLITSLPDGRNSELNRLFLRAGRLPMADQPQEIVASEAFAEAHQFQPGARLTAVINGLAHQLEIVGIGLSPEHIYQIKPGDLFPDFERYGVLWMNRSPLAAALDLEGAFNSLTLTLSREGKAAEVIDRVDDLLARYGGTGAISRADQLSHRYLELELEQLRSMAVIFPAIFLAVAFFLLNVVLSRLITTQRGQIAILKAFGYSHFQVGVHYFQMTLLIISLGIFLGLALGAWLGQLIAELYRLFFRFPYLEYHLGAPVIAIGVLATVAAGISGTFSAVRRAVLLPPAEAMRSEPPPSFRPSLIERLGLKPLFSQSVRMILRNIERRPIKSLLSVIGIAMACSILMVGRFQEGALDYLIRVQYGLAQREDLTVTFTEPTSRRVIHELAALPGVHRVEPFRSAAATLRNETATYRTVIQGLESHGDLRRVLSEDLQVVALPSAGLLLSDFLADYLGVRPGDRLLVEFLEGRRETREVTVGGTIREFTGANAYMEIAALNRLLREGTAISGALLAVDSRFRDQTVASLKEAPRVAGITDRLSAIRSFVESMAEVVLTFAFFSTMLAGSIAFGVVYNNARIALTERSRELASLRVIGYTRAEIRAILLGELLLLTLAALPLGFFLGFGLIAYIVRNVGSDLYRIPLVVGSGVYAFAAGVVLAATLLSGLVVARRLNRLDLVGALKTSE